LSSFDNKRFHFGFIVSGNSSDFRFNLNQDTTFNTSLYGVANAPQGGFNLALLASLNMSRHLKLRFVPGLSFQDRGLMYSFGQSSGGVNEILRRTESVNLDVPLLLKIRTDRLTNFAAYALIGAKYSRDMQSQEDVNQQLQNDDILRIQSSNFSMDLGGGIDIFLPFFKLAFELKTEIGLINVLIQDDSNYANPLEGLKTRSYIFSICFEG
ncbi:MAG TPA: PorT family protein, partial [Flavobacteriales bacterium]|nr:PorT family protein [Flavobacteriales bacterium]